MFVQIGCLSGFKALTDQVLVGDLQAVVMTLENVTTTSAIEPGVSFTNRSVTDPSTGDNRRESPSCGFLGPRSVEIAACINGLDAGVGVTTDYTVPSEFGSRAWQQVGTSQVENLRLGVAYNQEMLFFPKQERMEFEQNFTGEDMLVATQSYFAESGEVQVQGVGGTFLAGNAPSLLVPFPANITVGQTLVICVLHEVGIQKPNGWSLDYTGKIQGTSSGLPADRINTALSIFSKEVETEDVSTGSVEIYHIGQVVPT